MYYSIPYNDGGEEKLLVAVKNAEIIFSVLNNISEFDNSKIFILDEDANVIFDKNYLTGDGIENYIAEKSSDKSYSEIINIHNNMIKGDSNVEAYKMGNEKGYIAYSGINSANWSIGVSITKATLLGELKGLAAWIIVSSIIILIISMILVNLIINGLDKIIDLIKNTMDEFSKGNLHVDFHKKYLDRNDEVGNICRAVESTRSTVVDMIVGGKNNSNDTLEDSANLAYIADVLNGSTENIYLAMNEVASGTENQSNELLDI